MVAPAVSAEKNRRLLNGGRQSMESPIYQVFDVATLD